MSAPVLAVNLIVPGLGVTDIAQYIPLDTAPEITDAIEKPHESNEFVTSDLTLKGYDSPTNTVKTLFAGLLPTSLDFQLQIWKDGVKVFDGFILPNTVQFDQQERSFSFGAVGIAKRLTLTDASGLFLRSVRTWTLLNNAQQGDNYVVVWTNVNPGVCDFIAGDTIGIAVGNGVDDYQIADVAPYNVTPPYTSWRLTLPMGPTTTGISLPQTLKQLYSAGAAVTLLTPYQRNVSLQTAVNGLFNAAGLPSPTGTNFSVVPITTTGLLATAPNYTGIVGTPVGIAPLNSPGQFVTRTRPLLVTSAAAFSENLPYPQGTWYDIDTFTVPPIDSSNYNSGYGNKNYTLCGLRTAQQHSPGGSGTWVYHYYAYKYNTANAPGVTWYRYHLRITVSGANLQPPYPWSWELLRESSTDAVTWGSALSLATASGQTMDAFQGSYLAQARLVGIEYDVQNDIVFFTEPYDYGGAPNHEVGFRTSAWLTGSNTLVQGVTALPGIPLCPYPGHLKIFQLSNDVDFPVGVSHFTIHPDGTLVSTAVMTSISQDARPLTLKQNGGDGLWYMLTAGAQDGVWLVPITDINTMATDPVNHPSILLQEPGQPMDTVDLCVIVDRSRAAGQSWPMFGIFGAQLWWIDKTWSGIIPYLDLEGLSCADGEAQFATLVDGYYYVDAGGSSWFRTRSNAAANSIANPSGVNNDVIDDAGCLSLVTQPIWAKTYRYISVTNEKDSTITAHAGDPDYAKDPSLALALTNRFVTTISFAQALANTLFAYLGRGLRVVDIKREDDGRRYVMGYTFHATIDGVSRQFQIVQSKQNPASGLVEIVGVEL